MPGSTCSSMQLWSGPPTLSRRATFLRKYKDEQPKPQPKPDQRIRGKERRLSVQTPTNCTQKESFFTNRVIRESKKLPEIVSTVNQSKNRLEAWKYPGGPGSPGAPIKPPISDGLCTAATIDGFLSKSSPKQASKVEIRHKSVQRKATKLIGEFMNLGYKERLCYLKLTTLEERRLRDFPGYYSATNPCAPFNDD
ncbi:hypothetical protein BpHYR1_038433 [Brachionus plicatilis]|uniref:Uncharacterized protein n=1 Tax=Brachionus plicatilis TaxID=10195 RepID=A0A3M7PZQ2_BRAPC|nr:hypothetical protein BpHYR1_038433 [Brachionus plicatilis]